MTELGDYRLTVRACAATQITSTAAISGALAAGDCRTTFAPAADSSFADIFLFSSTGTNRDLTVTTSTFTPAFVVSGPRFAFESDLFLLSTLGSPATATVSGPLASGTYFVIVSAEGAITGDGSYTLQSSVAGSSARLEPPPSARPAWSRPAKGR